MDPATGEVLVDDLRVLLRRSRSLLSGRTASLNKSDLLPESVGALMVRVSESNLCRSSTIAEQLDISPSVFSRQLAQAESLGYVRRCNDDVDRRAALLSLTAEGELALARHRRAQRDLLLEILADMTEDEATLLAEQLHKLRMAMGRYEYRTQGQLSVMTGASSRGKSADV